MSTATTAHRRRSQDNQTEWYERAEWVSHPEYGPAWRVTTWRAGPEGSAPGTRRGVQTSVYWREGPLLRSATEAEGVTLTRTWKPFE